MASIRKISIPSLQRSFFLGQEVLYDDIEGIVTKITRDQFESIENGRPVYKIYITDRDGDDFLYVKIDGIPCEVTYNKPEEK